MKPEQLTEMKKVIEVAERKTSLIEALDRMCREITSGDWVGFSVVWIGDVGVRYYKDSNASQGIGQANCAALPIDIEDQFRDWFLEKLREQRSKFEAELDDLPTSFGGES